MHGRLFQFWHIASIFSFPPCGQMFVCFKFRTGFPRQNPSRWSPDKGRSLRFPKQFFKPSKLFSTVFFTDDAFSAISHDIDGISCFCWLKLLNPIGSLNPIKRFIFSDVLFKFFNYGFWVLPTISILIAKPFTLPLCSSWKWHKHCMQYIFTSNYYLCYCYTCIAHSDPKLYCHVLHM